MDNRTGFRRRGHGYLADQARSALGITGEVRVLAEIPLPMVHTAFGLAVAAAEVLLRPEAVGLNRSAICDGALALLTGFVLVAYDFLIYPSDSRPGPTGTALPMAAVLSSGTLLATSLPLPVRIGGGVIAAIVIGGVPRLAGRRALGKEGWFTRLLRDMSGIGVLAPVLLAGVSSALPLQLRIGVVFAVVVLVNLDGLRTEHIPIGWTILSALVVGAVVAGGADVAGGERGHDAGLRAAVLLVLWYGGRGVAGALGAPSRSRELIAEYTVFIVAAVAGLIWISVADL